MITSISYLFPNQKYVYMYFFDDLFFTQYAILLLHIYIKIDSKILLRITVSLVKNTCRILPKNRHDQVSIYYTIIGV